MAITHPGDSVFLNTVQRTLVTDRANVTDITDCVNAGADIWTACHNLYGWDHDTTRDRAARGDLTHMEFAQALGAARNRAARQG